MVKGLLEERVYVRPALQKVLFLRERVLELYDPGGEFETCRGVIGGEAPENLEF